MKPDFLTVLTVLAQVVVLGYVIFRTARLSGRGKQPLMPAFALFAEISLLMSSLYWLAYDLMRPESRMPFAANEIGEWAGFLLLSAVLNLAFEARAESAKWEMLGAAAFAAGSTALWIAWSGEWGQDIFCGMTFGWFLCSAARALKLSRAFSALEWRLGGAACAALLAAQAAALLAPERLRAGFDLFCYALMLLGMAFFTCKALLARKAAERLLALSFCAYAWTISCMYMSGGAFYLLAYGASTLMLLLLFSALRKAVEA